MDDFVDRDNLALLITPEFDWVVDCIDNFRIKAEQREEFERYANLPAGFEICPIRCLADDSADYLLTLNVYEVEGLASGRRAEWSTYILDNTNRPRYMVLEAASSTWSSLSLMPAPV